MTERETSPVGSNAWSSDPDPDFRAPRETDDSGAVAIAQAAHSPASASAIGAETPLKSEDLPLVPEFVAEAFEHLDKAEAELLRLERAPGDAEAVSAIFRAFHTIKGVAGFLNLKQIGALAHAAENVLQLARDGRLQIVGATATLILRSADAMRSLVRSLEDAAKSGQPMPVQEGLVELIACLGRTAKSPAGPADPKDEADSPPAVAPSAAPPVSVCRPNHACNREQTIKVATERLDSLINMVGELVIAELMVNQHMGSLAGAHPRLLRNFSHLGKITRKLQDLSMAMRMVPIQGVFQKMTRVARDLARNAGKEVNVVVTGAATELDRSVIEAIGDPLLHMVRNSIDHGIEPPEERQRGGKPRTGRIELAAEHKAGNIVIRIGDDGRGLDTARILHKAIEAGIVTTEQTLSEQEVFRLIFQPGLTTADRVTDVSGRGVGMDVVKRNIESLRGRIEISSVPGQGTAFTLRLPLTLAVIDGLLVRVGTERFVMPITAVEQSLRPTGAQVTTVQGRGEMCLFQGKVLPLHRLYRLFGLTPRTLNPTEGLIVVVRDGERLCCLMVDDLLGQQQVVIKALGDELGDVVGVSGGAILGDGCVSLILDVPGLIDLALRGASVGGH